MLARVIASTTGCGPMEEFTPSDTMHFFFQGSLLPSQELGLPIHFEKCLLAQFLILEHPLDVVTHGVAFSIAAVHEYVFVRIVVKVFIHKGIDAKLIQPVDRVPQHDDHVFDFEVTSPEEPK